jgi:hypothetical protein
MSATLGFAAVGIFWLTAIIILLSHFSRGREHRAVVRLAGFKWTRADFCRGWLITGDTGSGKTRSGITPLLFQVFRNEPTWGGLCIDDKGIYWETLSEMARHFGREDDLILLQVRPEDAGLHWQPKHTYNLTSDRSIPYNTFAKAVVDTAGSLGQAGDKGFFKSQAQIHIAAALETLYCVALGGSERRPRVRASQRRDRRRFQSVSRVSGDGEQGDCNAARDWTRCGNFEARGMVLIIDNYDSFTYNLVQYFGQLGREVVVKRNDQISLDEIRLLAPEKICLSPGPGWPEQAGICNG